jgi:hypothetical protein
MDKLRHIDSKIGSETAFRIPVSVEDAKAEAVEDYDEMEARVERLDKASRALLCSLSGYHYTINGVNVKDDLCEALAEKRAASLLLHDAQVLEKKADEVESGGAWFSIEKDGNIFTNTVDEDTEHYLRQSAAALRQQADALEGEGDG